MAKSGTLYYPIWLASAAGNLESEFEVSLVDAEAEKCSLELTIEKVKAFSPALLVIDTSTPSILNDVEVAEAVSTALPGVIIALTGTHPSAMPAETLALSEKVGVVVRGEIDATLLELARAIRDDQSLSTVDGISFRKEGEVNHNPARELITDLDSLPILPDVYKRHLKLEKYFFAAARHPMVMTMTGRGCPNNCFFCLYPQTIHGRRYRFRSVESVVSEFEYIMRELPEVRDVGIEDDTFTADLERARIICRELIRIGAPQKIRWWVNTRVTTDFETLRLMKKAGCRLVIPGFESGSQKMLDRMKKGITLEQSRAFMKNTRRAGLLVHGCFVVGAPGETRETMQKTLGFALELNPDTVQFFPIIPYPGTEAWAWAKERGLLHTTDFSDWVDEDGMHNTVFDGEHVSAKEMVAFCDEARKRFYLRPRYLLYKAWQCLRHPQEARRTFLSARVFFKHILAR